MLMMYAEVAAVNSHPKIPEIFDAAVIGGGVAGLSGALTLARARRSVVVVDSRAPRNAPSPAVHGLLALDGVPPAQILERGRAEVGRYGGHLVNAEVTAVTRDEAGLFTVTPADGDALRARRLLVASGLVDELPEMEGLGRGWGTHVLHCPYCHGWEVRDRAMGVIATGPFSVQQALLFRQFSEDVIYFTHTNPTSTAEEQEALAARGVRMVDGEVAAVEWDGDRLTGVRLADGSRFDREVLVVSSRLAVRARFLRPLGLEPVPHPWGIGDHIPCDDNGRTAVPGVWLAGNVGSVTDRAAAASAAAVSAAAQINADLLAEETREAVTAHRAARAASS